MAHQHILGYLEPVLYVLINGWHCFDEAVCGSHTHIALHISSSLMYRVFSISLQINIFCTTVVKLWYAKCNDSPFTHSHEPEFKKKQKLPTMYYGDGPQSCWYVTFGSFASKITCMSKDPRFRYELRSIKHYQSLYSEHRATAKKVAILIMGIHLNLDMFTITLDCEFCGNYIQ